MADEKKPDAPAPEEPKRDAKEGKMETAQAALPSLITRLQNVYDALDDPAADAIFRSRIAGALYDLKCAQEGR